MKQIEIENRLREWFQIMINKYDWLSIKFEFSEKYRSYIVSFYPMDKIDESDAFCQEAIAFENNLNSLYGDTAPLFCDEESIFQLSDDAEIISNKIFRNNNTTKSTIWNRSYEYFIEELDYQSDYQLAA